MIDPDRLDELSTWLPESDTPDDAKIRIPAGDLRDLVALIPVVRAAIRWGDEKAIFASTALSDMCLALDDLVRAKGDG